MSATEPNQFKIVQLNAENLFIFLDDHTARDWRKVSEKDWQNLSHATVDNKSLLKTLWLADSLKAIDADIICLNEVGGMESLANFTSLFLPDYVPHLIEGNSDRGIDIGYLVKKTFPYHAELRTHKNRPIDFLYPHELQTNLFEESADAKKSHFFSRDCAEMRFYKSPGDPVPALIILLVHLKSQLDRDRIDPNGRDRREAELKTLIKIYEETQNEFPVKVPTAVIGDFNGAARKENRSKEFDAIATTNLESVIDLAGLEGEDATTQIQFHRSGGTSFLQIDYIFVSPELRAKLVPESVHVFRYRSDLDVTLPLPKTFEQRLYMPSDHYPVVATFTF